MRHHWRRLAFCAGLFITLLVSPGIAAEAELPSEAVVLLEDGRSITGRLDAKTDEQTLWIRQTDGGVVLRSGFAWDRVATVLHDRQSQDRQDVLRTTARLDTNLLEEAGTPLAILAEPTAPDRQQPLNEFDHIRQHRLFARPASLQIQHVGLAHWNRDAAVDGLEASLIVVDDFGRCVPVSGQLEISLIGMRQQVFGGAHVNRRQPLFVEIGRWSVPLRGPAPPEGEIWLRLPLTRVSPLDPTIADSAHLHVRLSVPGSGSFEAARVVNLR